MAIGKRTKEEIIYIKENLLSIFASQAKKIGYYDEREKEIALLKVSKLGIDFIHKGDELVDLLLNLERWEIVETPNCSNVNNLCSWLASYIVGVQKKNQSVFQDLMELVVRIEPFLRSVHGLVYSHSFSTYDGQKYECSTGVCLSAPELSVKIYGPHILGLANLPQLNLRCSFNQIDGKIGITDPSSKFINKISNTYRMYRNLYGHGEDIRLKNITSNFTMTNNTPNTSCSEENSYCEYQDDYEIPADAAVVLAQPEDLGYIFNALWVLILHILDYRFDTLTDRIKPTIDTLSGNWGQRSIEDKQQIAIDYLRTKYIPQLIASADEKLSRHILIDITISPADYLINSQVESDEAVSLSEEQVEKEKVGDIHETMSLDLFHVVLESDIQRMILCGGSGTGKSTSLTRLMREWAKSWDSENSQTLLPVRVELYNYNHIQPNSLSSLLKPVAPGFMDEAEREAVSSYFKQLLKAGRVVLLLDGLNEVTPRLQPKLMEDLKQLFISDYPNARLLISSRIEEELDMLPQLKQLSIDKDEIISCFTLNVLTEQQMKLYNQRKFQYEKNKATASRIWGYISNSTVLKKLANNPLQLQLITDILFTSSSIDDVQLINRASLYKEYIERFVQREMIQNAMNKADREEEMKNFNYRMSELALLLLNSEQKSIQSFDCHLTGSEIIMAEKAGLVKTLRTEDATELSFQHDSYHHYFAAKWILYKANDQKLREELINNYIVISNQHEILRMIVELQASIKNDTRLSLILTTYLSLMKRTCTTSGINLGLAVLAKIIPVTPVEDVLWRAGEIEKAPISVRMLFDGLMLNVMNAFRLKCLSNQFDETLYLKIIELISISSSSRLIDELFTPFWLSLWALDVSEAVEMGAYIPEIISLRPKKMNYYINVISTNLTISDHFYSKLFQLTEHFKIKGLNKSLSYLLNVIACQWNHTDDVTLHFIYQHLTEFSNTIPYAKDYAPRTLLSMNDPSWVETFNDLYKNKFEIKVSKELVAKQFPNIKEKSSYSSSIFDLLFPKINQLGLEERNCFVYMLALKDVYTAEIIHRLLAIKNKMDYDSTYISRFMKYNRPIFDLYPLTHYTDEELSSIGLDIDTARLTNDVLENAGARIPYIVSGITVECIIIIVPDIAESFEEKSLLLPQYSVTIQKRKYISYKIIQSKRLVMKHTQVEVRRVDGLSIPLPMYGKIKSSNVVCNQWGEFEYTAKSSNQQGLLLEVFTPGQIKLFSRLKDTNTTIYIDNIPCQIVSVSISETANLFRLLYLERQIEWPLHADFALVTDLQGNIQQRINNNLLTPLEYSRRFFRKAAPISSLESVPAYYSLFGYKGNTALLWTELACPEAGSYITFTGDKKNHYMVSRVDDFPLAFVELHLSGGNISQITSTGILHLVNRNLTWVTDTQIPYIYAYKSDNQFVLRVEDQEWVERLRLDKNLKDNMIYEQTYRIGSIPFRIMQIDVIYHIPNSKCMVIKLGGGTLPTEGTFKYADMKKNKPLVKFLPGQRLKFMEIKVMKCIGTSEDEKKYPLLESRDEDVVRGLRKNLWFRFSSDIRIFKAKRRSIQQTDRVVFEILCDELKIQKESNVCNIELMCYCPVKNEQEKDFFERKNSFLVDNVHYVVFRNMDNKLHIRFPKPKNDLSQLYFRISENIISQVSESSYKVVEDEFNPYNEVAELRISVDVEVAKEGMVSFYYDSDCNQPVILEYHRLLSLIALNSPNRYHRDTCQILFKECRQAGIFTSQVCDFLYKRSCASLLMDEFLNDSNSLREKKYPADLCFNVCTVVHHNSSNLVLFSAKDFKLVTSYDVKDNLTAGSLVLLEQNGRVIPINSDKRLRQLGYLRGIVVHVDEIAHDAHIRVKDLRLKNAEDFFYHYTSDNPLHYGDVVTFLPSANRNRKEKWIAIRLKFESSSVRKGIVYDIYINHETQYREYTIQDLDNKDLYGVLICHSEENKFNQNLMTYLAVGNEVTYFFLELENESEPDEKRRIFILR